MSGKKRIRLYTSKYGELRNDRSDGERSGVHDAHTHIYNMSREYKIPFIMKRNIIKSQFHFGGGEQ